MTNEEMKRYLERWWNLHQRDIQAGRGDHLRDFFRITLTDAKMRWEQQQEQEEQEVIHIAPAYVHRDDND